MRYPAIKLWLPVLVFMVATSTHGHALSIELNLPNLEAMMAAAITDGLLVSALTDTSRTTTMIADAAHSELDKYLSASDAEAAVKRFRILLSALIKGSSDEVLRSALKPEIVRNLLTVAVDDALKRDKLAEKVGELADSVNMLNYGVKPKIIRAEKEAEFLFDLQVGVSSSMNDDIRDVKCSSGQSAHLVAARRAYGPRYTVIHCVKPDASPGENTVVREVELTSDEATEYKMRSVEKILGIRPAAEETIIERIGNAQKRIHNYEWDRNHLRFAIMEAYVKQIEALSTSIVLHAYPSYRQCIPGNLDLERRMSFYVGIGTASKKTADAELRGPVYSYGIGFDIREGIGFTVGGSMYTMEDTSLDRSERMHTGITFGVTLNSDLWNALFGNR